MNFRQILVFGAMAAALAGGGYYYFEVRAPEMAAQQAAAGKRVLPPAPVTVASVAREAVPVVVGTIGTVQPVSTVSIRSRVDGQIFKVGFQEGQMVRKGDLLFQIDPRSFEAALQQSQAALARDRSQLAKDKADLSRYTALSQRDFASKQKYEDVRATAEGMEATVRADEAAVAQVKLSLDYTEIRSPIDGRTGNLLVSAGNLVKANDTPALVVINQIQPIYVSFNIAQQNLPDVRDRMAQGTLPVVVTIPGDHGPEVKGALTFINNAVDTSTGTIQLKASFGNADGRLVPGQFVNVSMTLETLKEALVVPSQAVQTGQAGSYVFVVKPDKTVEQRMIQLGPTVNAKSVIMKGLAAGERVVTDGQLRLFPGARVDVKNAA